MSQFVRHEPCPDCGSSDALAVYSSGVSFCYSCKKKTGESLVSHPEGAIKGLKKRGIMADTCQRFGYMVTKDSHAAPLVSKDGTKIVGWKYRGRDKAFWIDGQKINHFWGMHACQDKGKMIVITEGEIDCLSVSQAGGNRYPTVSLPNGSGSAGSTFRECSGWLQGFERVVLMFDQDEAGQQAVQEAIRAMPPGTVYVATLPGKDANDVLLNHGEAAIIKAAWDAKRYRPEAVVTGEDLLEHIHKEIPKSTPTPWESLNKLIIGLRPTEILMLCGGSGSGKSTVSRELALSLALDQKVRVGYIALEETVQGAVLRMAAIHTGVPLLHIDPTKLPTEKLDETVLKIGENMAFLDMAFTTFKSEDLQYNIRYLVQALGCQFVFLDHISIVVSGDESMGQNERRSIDELMTTLRGLSQTLDAGFVIVSHLKRPFKGKEWEEGRQPRMADLRGSAALEQLSDTIIGISRNMRSDDPEVQNIANLEVLKNRAVALVGDAGSLEYSLESGRMKPVSDEVSFDAIPSPI